MNKAISYARVSKEGAITEGVSLDMQEERIRDYCKLMGLEIVEAIREDGISASIPLHERPGGKRLTSLINAKQAGHVVALKLDRLFRDAEDALKQSKEWDRLGVALHLVDMGGATINTATAMGRFFLNMIAGFAEFERNLIVERTTEALRYKKQHLEAYSPTPYGYRRIGKRLIEDPEEQAVIEKIFWMKRAGFNTTEIVEALNGEGIPAKMGGKWHPAVVRQILRNDLHKEKRIKEEIKG